MGLSINKNGIINASDCNINPNLCTQGYSRNPYIPNTAGSTVLSLTDNGTYMRYTATTQGSDGGKYGYPTSNDNLVQGTVYTQSCELRSNVALTFSRGRIGFEGGGMISGSAVKIGTEQTRISNTQTQTSSKAFVIYPCGDLANGNQIDIRNLKLEQGSTATPFIIPSSETTRYIGTNIGIFDDFAIPARIGSNYIIGKEIIEI